MALIGIQRINDIMYGIYGLINFGTFNKIKAINTLSSGILIPWQKALNHQPGIKNTNYIFNKVLELGMKIKKPAKSTKFILPTRRTSAFLLRDTRCTILNPIVLYSTKSVQFTTLITITMKFITKNPNKA